MNHSSIDSQVNGKSNNRKNATLRDVANLAGVSTKTVSRVVNHQNEISEETRQRVQAAIEQLDYRPNILARSLIHQRSRTFAAVAWGIDYYGPSRTILGIVQGANQLGYSLILNLVSNPMDDHTQILNELISRRVDGIIWAIPEVGNNHLWLDQVDLDRLPPFVFLSMGSRPDLSIVSIDNRDGAKKAVNHLLQEGRRKIGIITGPLAWWEANERYLGWKEALEEAGIPPSPSLVYRSDNWTSDYGKAGMQALLEREPQIDGLFASNDQIALGALGIAHQMNRRVPQDIAIVGFDNIPEAAFLIPPLSTIYQNVIDMGNISVKLLHEKITSSSENSDLRAPMTTVLKPELLIRASSHSCNG